MNEKLKEDMRKLYRDADYERGTASMLLLSALYAADHEDEDGCRNYIADLTSQLEQMRDRLALIVQNIELVEIGIAKGDYAD